MGRTVTGRGRIMKLCTWNKMCWFKLGLEKNPTKQERWAWENQSSHSNPVKGAKRKKREKIIQNILFQPSQEVSSEDGIWEDSWNNMCRAAYDLRLLQQWKMEKKLEEVPSSDCDPSQKAIYRMCVLCFRGTQLCNKVWNMFLYACKHLHAHTHTYTDLKLFLKNV